jgi:hypothetical protein
MRSRFRAEAQRKRGRKLRGRCYTLQFAAAIAAVCLISAGVDGTARAATITQSNSGFISSSIDLFTQAGRAFGLGMDDDAAGGTNARRGRFVSFGGFDPALGTLTAVRWDITFTQVIRATSGSTCIDINPVTALFPCPVTSTTAGIYETEAFILDGVSGAPAYSAVIGQNVTNVGSGVIICAVLTADCVDTRTNSNQPTTSIVRTVLDGLSAYTLQDVVVLELANEVFASHQLHCTFQLTRIKQCNGKGTVSGQTNALIQLTYEYEPFDATVPVPAAALLFLTGFAALVFRRKKQDDRGS